MLTSLRDGMAGALSNGSGSKMNVSEVASRVPEETMAAFASPVAPRRAAAPPRRRRLSPLRSQWLLQLIAATRDAIHTFSFMQAD